MITLITPEWLYWLFIAYLWLLIINNLLDIYIKFMRDKD